MDNFFDIAFVVSGSGFELTVNPKSEKESITDEMLPHIRNTVPNALKLPKRHNKDDSARLA